MPVFAYTGRNVRGEMMEGQIDSPSPQAVASWMISAGITPILIRRSAAPSDQPQWLRELLGWRSLLDVDLILFTRQMGTMVKSGVPMMQALASIQKSTRKQRLVDLIQALRDRLDKGLELSAAMAYHPDFFNEYYVNMVKVGEGAGRLEEAFQRLFTQLSFERTVKQKIKGAVRYPIFVLTAIAIGITVLNLYVIPVFARVYAGFKVSLPPLTQLLIAVSNFMVNYWWALVAAVVLAIYGFHSYTSTRAGRYRWDKYKLRIPIVGAIMVKAAIARFALSLSMASRSGIPLMLAFTLVSRVVDNTFYEQRILQMRDGVERGESMYRVAQSAGIFAPLELQMISVGEETGEIDNMLEQVSTMYREDLEYDVERLGETLEPILIACMAVLVLVLLLAVFLPLWDLGHVAIKRA